MLETVVSLSGEDIGIVEETWSAQEGRDQPLRARGGGMTGEGIW